MHKTISLFNGPLTTPLKQEKPMGNTGYKNQELLDSLEGDYSNQLLLNIDKETDKVRDMLRIMDLLCLAFILNGAFIVQLSAEKKDPMPTIVFLVLAELALVSMPLLLKEFIKSVSYAPNAMEGEILNSDLQKIRAFHSPILETKIKPAFASLYKVLAPRYEHQVVPLSEILEENCIAGSNDNNDRSFSEDDKNHERDMVYDF
ncbi:hypothetical protein HOG98_05720 [bacterium]|jgi:hypothetical protein|nr:hypothetical protein [bacterium]